MSKLEQAYLKGGSIANCFDLVVGTSTGGIIALGLGAGLSATNLLDIYIGRGGEVFPAHSRITKKILNVNQFLFNRCNRKQLDRLIDDMLRSRQIWESRFRICVPSAETRHFEPFIFKTPHHPDYRLDWKWPMALAAKATSAAPTFFTPVKSTEGYEFIDGGIWANNPTMVGIADALACFDLSREQIRILSLGCIRSDFKMSCARRHLGGLWFWRSIILESMHIESQNVIGQARLIIGGDRVLRIEAPAVRPEIELWNWERCRAELPAIADRSFEEHGPRISKEFLSTVAAVYSPYYTPASPPDFASDIS